MNNIKKVIVAHPHKQHSFQMASALKEDDKLYKYITTVYDKKGSLTSLSKIFLKGDLKNKANTRKNNAISDDEVIQYCEFLGLFQIFIGKVFGYKKLWHFLNRIISSIFSIKTAKYAIKNNVDAIVCYDEYAYKIFNKIKKTDKKIICILDVSSASKLYMKKVFEEDIKRFNTRELKKEMPYIWKKKYLEERKKEILLSDLLLVPSEYVKKSLIYAGANQEKIKICAYGVNILTDKINLKKQNNDRINLLYVGRVRYSKGLHHLLPIIKEYKDKFILNILGDYDKNTTLYKKYSNVSNINFIGFVTRDQLSKYFYNADVFVLPTLSEGFSLAILEAMGAGLPILTTDHSGATEAIENNYNGFIYKVGDINELKKILLWMTENKSKLKTISKNAYTTSKKYSWENYKTNIIKIFNKL